MASIRREKGKGWRLTVRVNGKRKRKSLGGTVALRIRNDLESLVSDLEQLRCYAKSEQLDIKMRERLDAAGPDIKEWFAGIGLISECESKTLREFCEKYIEDKDVKPITASKMQNSLNHLCEFFGEACLLKDITAGDAEDWVQSRIRKGAATATWTAELKHARQFLKKRSITNY